MKLLERFSFLLLLITVDSRLNEQHRPCSFNPLCTCSNGGPDLGSVCCHNIPFMTVPSQINSSAIYIMSLKGNKLRFLEESSLNGTGLWKLQINDNLLTDLPFNALAGLEKTLSILDLSKNNLIRIPREAIHNLEKLNSLYLAENQITYLQNDDFRNLGRTLKHLDLSENALTHIQSDVFRNMIVLEVLNLAYNSIISIDDLVFQSGLNNLKHLMLMGNQLRQIPLNTIANLKNIKIVNLNKNLIAAISEGREIRSRIYLDEFHLEYNLIEELTAESFRLFHQVHRIFLKGNPLTKVNNTFMTINSTEIHMSHCSISVISSSAFFSVTHTLQVLDLSYNNLKVLPSFPLMRLTKLSLAGNLIKEMVPDNFKYYANSLKYLDISGPNMGGLTQESMKHLPNLRELFLNIKLSVLNTDSLQNIGSSMEKLFMKKSPVKIIENGAFQKLNSLKVLDLSYNTISKIENSSFREIRHTLEKLILHDAFKMKNFPHKALNSLSMLEYFDASSNSFIYLPSESLASFNKLRYLNLNYNNLKYIDSNFVSDVNNPNLENLKMAFNEIKAVNSNVFRNLQNLVYLQLNDNMIEHIRRSVFMDLDSIKVIRLEGNMIELIDNEAFQNLPSIQFINLSYNKLLSLNLEAFNQVGRLSTLRIDVSHNNIQNLTGKYTVGHTSSNIKNINFKKNNISFISRNYFDPIRMSVTALDLSHNQIENLSSLAFANMAHLQTLILSENEIELMQEKEFLGLKSLQILDLSKNNLERLEEKLFQELKRLRIFTAADNYLAELPANIFITTVLEQLDLSYNSFEEYPHKAILQVKDTLQLLDLTGNNIRSLKFNEITSLENLRHFSISQNRLFLPDSAEFYLPKLISLDLSYNPIEELPSWIANHLPTDLEALNLANTSLKTFPILNACKILYLNLSSNMIETIHIEVVEQIKNLQTLDLSNNLLLTTYNNIWANLQHLRSLYLQMNPIQSFLNNSFSNMERLQELFVRNVKPHEINKDSFQPLSALRTLEIDIYSDKSINVSQLLSKNQGIQKVHLHIKDNEVDKQFSGYLPKSLKVIILEGEHLKELDESIFSSIQSPVFTLDIRNSNVTKISRKVFENMRGVKNFTVSFNDNYLQKIERIMENEAYGKSLKHLKLLKNHLNCDCDLAWIWKWLKEYEYKSLCEEGICDEAYLPDLRETRCSNFNNRSIINIFKTELDCFSSRGTRTSTGVFYFTIVIVIVFYIHKNIQL